MTLASAGDATEVEVGATLGLTATPDVTLNGHFYTIVWSVDSEAVGTVLDKEGTANTLTGVSADDIVVTAEIKAVDYVNGARTLVSLDTPITDTITITVTST